MLNPCFEYPTFPFHPTQLPTIYTQ
jgi:hypothetical protein